MGTEPMPPSSSPSKWNANWARWLPLILLVTMALAFEPFRSGFTFDTQSCEVLADWERTKSAVFNARHIISYGILCLVASATLRKNKVVMAVLGTFVFSAFLELEQSFFITGHCRLRDLIPNVLGIGLAAGMFQLPQVWV